MKLLYFTLPVVALIARASARDLDEYACECKGVRNRKDMVDWLDDYFTDDSVCGPAWDFWATRSCGLGVPSGRWCANAAGWAILKNGDIKCCKEPHRWCQDALSECSKRRGGGGGGGNYLVRPSHDAESLYSC